ncbi:c-type cytochrome [Methylobacterium sp. WSM2598]|uniref:c-type cytochrome n=1 Tax=Methylobacterium sp. WSM2598 TaxID=398261 RepID=UPI00037839B3|nr:cytochrome c [Methylobacterium sp. WSM2598]
MMRAGLVSLFAFFAAVSVWPALAASARDAKAERGLYFALVHCARCHAVDRSGRSRLRAAPPFRDLAGRVPVDDLADVLVEGVAYRHPAMPEFRLEPDEASDLTAYLKSLRR